MKTSEFYLIVSALVTSFSYKQNESIRYALGPNFPGPTRPVF